MKEIIIIILFDVPIYEFRNRNTLLLCFVYKKKKNRFAIKSVHRWQCVYGVMNGCGKNCFLSVKRSW